LKYRGVHSSELAAALITFEISERIFPGAVPLVETSSSAAAAAATAAAAAALSAASASSVPT